MSTITDNEIKRGIELLTLCLKMQNEKDGVDRVFPSDGVDRTKVLDQFAIDIAKTVRHLHSLPKLLTMLIDLSNVGRAMEAEGTIKVGLGDGFSRAALDHLLAEYGVASTAE